MRIEILVFTLCKSLTDMLQTLEIYQYVEIFGHRLSLTFWPLVVRAHGLQRLRVEKSWRPVVMVTVGNNQCHELNLGCDGQNPNLKQCFQL